VGSSVMAGLSFRVEHFERHWGDHAIDALRALHRACRQR